MMEMTSETPDKTGVIRGRVIYVLVLVILAQTIYPITVSESIVPLILYQVLYTSLMLAGGLVSHERPFYRRMLIVLGVVWFVTGFIYTFNQSETWALLSGYSVLIIFQAVVIKVLLQFIFVARTIGRDVLFAATAVYLLIGAVFVPVYGIVETFTYMNTGEHAFSDPQVEAGTVFPWQNFVYLSYTTLTTVGYGDVLPINLWARSMANIEAVIGTLYVTIIMARLVGLYTTQEVAEAVEERQS